MNSSTYHPNAISFIGKKMVIDGQHFACFVMISRKYQDDGIFSFLFLEALHRYTCAVITHHSFTHSPSTSERAFCDK